MISARPLPVAAMVLVVSLGLVPSVLEAGQAPARLAVPVQQSISGDLSALASRLNVGPSELVAISGPGAFPDAWAQVLLNAYQVGLGVATTVGVDAQHASFVGGQFAECLIRIERESRSRGKTPFSDLVDAVRRDVRETLRLNFGEQVAAAAEPGLSSLTPLRIY